MAALAAMFSAAMSFFAVLLPGWLAFGRLQRGGRLNVLLSCSDEAWAGNHVTTTSFLASAKNVSKTSVVDILAPSWHTQRTLAHALLHVAQFLWPSFAPARRPARPALWRRPQAKATSTDTTMVKQCSQRWRTREASRHRCECRLRCLQQQLGSYVRTRTRSRSDARLRSTSAPRHRASIVHNNLKAAASGRHRKASHAVASPPHSPALQRALDAAENAPRASASIDPIDVADLATAQGRERLAEDLKAPPRDHPRE